MREERATYLGPEVLDAARRRGIALAEAAQGTIWIAAAFAVRCGVTQVTASKALGALVQLADEGARKIRLYQAVNTAPDSNSGAPTAPL